MLQPYRLHRFTCTRCGTFERAVAASLPVVRACTGCGDETTVIEETVVTGMTSAPLPWVTKPHSATDPGRPWYAKSNYRSSANGKSTGRPRKHPPRAERERKKQTVPDFVLTPVEMKPDIRRKVQVVVRTRWGVAVIPEGQMALPFRWAFRVF